MLVLPQACSERCATTLKLLIIFEERRCISRRTLISAFPKSRLLLLTWSDQIGHILCNQTTTDWDQSGTLLDLFTVTLIFQNFHISPRWCQSGNVLQGSLICAHVSSSYWHQMGQFLFYFFKIKKTKISCKKDIKKTDICPFRYQSKPICAPNCPLEYWNDSCSASSPLRLVCMGR